MNHNVLVSPHHEAATWEEKYVDQGCMGTSFPPLFVPSHNSQITMTIMSYIHPCSLDMDSSDVCFIDWPPAASSSNDAPLPKLKFIVTHVWTTRFWSVLSAVSAFERPQTQDWRPCPVLYLQNSIQYHDKWDGMISRFRFKYDINDMDDMICYAINYFMSFKEFCTSGS